MSIDNLTIRELKELKTLIGGQNDTGVDKGIHCMIGEKVIIRTYSAGSGCSYGSGDGDGED